MSKTSKGSVSAIRRRQFPHTSNSTLIEANFADWFGTPRANFHVSFVEVKESAEFQTIERAADYLTLQ